ncbi:MAG: prolipoprotein diacylglyceryl transferase, partial [Chloroflexi bacterium]|nr:prolipoprotein diacylglyceryl transferase [Chloroflexota bacterium]
PVAFVIGSTEVRWYGIMVTTAIAVMVGWIIWQVKRGAEISYDDVLTGALVAIPSGIVFSRLLHVLDYWEYYGSHTSQILGLDGLSIYGGILGAVIGIFLFSHFSNRRFGYIMDIVAPIVPVAQIIGRMGCVLNGCCYGKETDIFCAVTYTDPDSSAPTGISVHPTQIYEMIFLAITAVIIWKLKDRVKKVEGSLFLIYITAYSLWRFLIGFFRDGQDFFLGLLQAQVIGLIVVIIVVPVLVYRWRKYS